MNHKRKAQEKETLDTPVEVETVEKVVKKQKIELN